MSMTYSLPLIPSLVGVRKMCFDIRDCLHDAVPVFSIFSLLVMLVAVSMGMVVVSLCFGEF